MYQILLSIHSYWRWGVLISLLFSCIKSGIDFRKNHGYSAVDELVRKVTVSIIHVQLLLGFTIYFISPLVAFFFKNVNEGLHLREIRFFAIEHSLMMVVSIVIVTIGAVKIKRKETSKLKHKATLIWCFQLRYLLFY